MKDRVVVLGRAGEAASPFRRLAKFSVDYDYHPNDVIRAVNDALAHADIPDVSRYPPPVCLCREFEDTGIAYQVAYRPRDVGRMLEAESEVLLHVYVALEREGMAISPSKHQIEHKPDSQPQLDAAEIERRVAALDRLELLAMLTGEERGALARELHRLPFGAGETLFRKGEAADSLYILAAGRVRIVDEDRTGAAMQLAELAAPAYFGEMGLLTGQARHATVVAAEPMLCYRLGKSAFDAILKARPAIAGALAEVLAKRQADNAALLQSLDMHAQAAGGGARDLLRRIRRFFELPAEHA
jgi:CRP-like cAMP-binding protein